MGDTEKSLEHQQVKRAEQFEATCTWTQRQRAKWLESNTMHLAAVAEQLKQQN